jgi:hypothetical protein
MATLEQLAEGIRRAHQAGNAEHVRVLGQAYRQMQAQQAAPPNPYEAGATRLKGKVADLPSRQPVRPDLMTATANTISGITNAIPIMGPLAQGIVDNIGGHISQAMGGEFDAPVKRRQELIARDPVAYGAGNLAGALASFGAMGATSLGADALGLTGKMLPGALKAAASNQGLYTADQFARGNTGMDTLGYGVPALLGAGGRVVGDAVGAAGQKVADAVTGASQRGLTSAAIKGAPAADDLAQASRQMFQEVDNSGVTVDPNRFGNFVVGLLRKAAKDRMNPSLDPKAYAAFQEIAKAADDAMRGNGVLTISDLHTLRQIAQKAAISSEGRDAMFANRIVQGIDDFITSPSATIVPPGSKDSANTLLNAISTWGRSKRVGLIEEAIYKARNQASGFENGLRIQFRQLLQNKRTRALFTKPELQAIQAVANGTSLSNAMRLLGKFGFGGGSASNMLGGTIGFGAGSMTPLGPLGGILAAGVGTGARKATEVLSKKAAERAAQVVATPNIPVARQFPNLLLPLKRPADYLVRSEGGLLAQ